MSKGLAKLLKKHPRLMSEYRRFVVGVVGVVVEKEFQQQKAKS